MRQMFVAWSSAGSAYIPLVRFMKFMRRFAGGARGAALVARSAAATTRRRRMAAAAECCSAQCAACSAALHQRRGLQYKEEAAALQMRSIATELRAFSHRLP